jgi:hypothetical protein
MRLWLTFLAVVMAGAAGVGWIAELNPYTLAMVAGGSYVLGSTAAVAFHPEGESDG